MSHINALTLHILIQLEEFRKLLGDDGEHHIEDNYRPVQPLNGRTVS